MLGFLVTCKLPVGVIACMVVSICICDSPDVSWNRLQHSQMDR